MSDSSTHGYNNRGSVIRLDAYSGSTELKPFLLTIIDGYTEIQKQRLQLLLFLGEMIYAEKHDGETMGDTHYQISTGIWSQEFEHIVTDILPELYNITVEHEQTTSDQDPITRFRTCSDTSLRPSTTTPPRELGEIVVDATKNKTLDELRFWFEKTRLARMHNTNEVLTKSVINQYVASVKQNKVVPVWSQLI